MRIVIQPFLGEIPKLEPELLPQGYAQEAISARLENGALAPMRKTASLHTFGAAVGTIYLHDTEWLGFTGDVDVEPGPVANDRLYITGDGAPKMRFDGTTYGLRLPPPVNGPVIANVTAHDPTIEEDVFYAYTWVTSLGEESRPSPLSNRLTTSVDVAVRIDTFDTPPAGRLITKMRLYRSQTSASGQTELFFVDEVDAPPTTTTFDHAISLLALNELIASTDYDEPPDDLAGLTALPNGMMAAFRGKDVYFCEPYLPHAWPEKYVLTTNDAIVGLAAFGSTLVVMTEATPYRIQGTAPEFMVMERMEENFPCVSKRGIVDLGYAAAYPSTDGLVTIDSSGARVVTRPLYTREQWQALNPAGFVAAQFMSRYAFSHQPDGSTARTIGLIDLLGQAPFVIHHDVATDELVYDLASGRLLGLTGGTNVIDLDNLDADHDTLKWRSRKFQFPVPVSFGAIQVEGRHFADEVDEFFCEIYADGEFLHEISRLNTVERLPMGEHSVWEFKIEGNATVTRLIAAGSPTEIAGA